MEEQRWQIFYSSLKVRRFSWLGLYLDLVIVTNTDFLVNKKTCMWHITGFQHDTKMLDLCVRTLFNGTQQLWDPNIKWTGQYRLFVYLEVFTWRDEIHFKEWIIIVTHYHKIISSWHFRHFEQNDLMTIYLALDDDDNWKNSSAEIITAPCCGEET